MNFTVVMSGGCRAKCHFCTDPMNRAASRDYVANLAKFLVQKPEFLKEVSVSGGETHNFSRLPDNHANAAYVLP